MVFTQEDYIKIQQWLSRNSIKDTEFNEANIPFNGEEIVTIVQGNQNKKVFLRDLASQLVELGVSDFINITEKYNAPNISLEEAIRLIPSRARKEGQVITFLDNENNWHIYQFKGSLIQWNILDQWEDLFDWEKFIIDSILPDEEDLTKSPADENGNSYLSLKDRDYNPEDFSGLGRVILRKNIVEVEDPIYGKVKKNILYQDIINKSNTTYEIRYDFDLNDSAITIPEGCILNFQGGSFSNGTIIGNGTIIKGEDNILKDISIQGDFNSDISLKIFNLENPKNNFSILYDAFSVVRKFNKNVIFDVKRIDIELSESDIQRGPIEFDFIDFNNTEIHVVNNIESFTLFTHKNNNPLKEVSIEPSLLDGYDYSSVSSLSKGDFILKASDKTEWVKRNDPNDTQSYTRSDVILIHDGYSENTAIYTYSGNRTDPKFEYIEVTPFIKGIQNANFLLNNSRYTIGICSFSYENNINIRNINIRVENDYNISHGVLFMLSNCSTITVENCIIYGQFDNSGYAYMFNTTGAYNVYFSNIKCVETNWHFNCAYYTNKITVVDSTINGLDSHLYNKDYTLRNCFIRKHPIGAEGVYGKVIIDNCQINHSVIANGGSSYNIYNNYDLIIKDCVVTNSATILHLYQISNSVNDRLEIAEKCLPSIYIDGLTCIGDSITLFQLADVPSPTWTGITIIQLKNIKFISSATTRTVSLASRNCVIGSTFRIDIDNMDVINKSDDNIDTPANIWANAFVYRNIKPVNITPMIVNNSRFGVNEQLDSKISYTFNNCTIEHPYEDNAIAGISRNFNNCKIIFDREVSLPINSVYKDCEFDKRISGTLKINYSGYYKFYNCKKLFDGNLLSVFNGLNISEELNLDIDRYDQNSIVYWFNKVIARSSFTLPAGVKGQLFNTTLNKPIYWTGSKWVDATGANV